MNPDEFRLAIEEAAAQAGLQGGWISFVIVVEKQRRDILGAAYTLPEQDDWDLTQDELDLVLAALEGGDGQTDPDRQDPDA